MPKNKKKKKKQTGIRRQLPNSTCTTNCSESTILLANPPKPHSRRTLNTCVLYNHISGGSLVSTYKLTLTFASSGKGLYGNKESTWQLHSVKMTFISMWPLIYLNSLFKIFLSKSIHTVFGLYKYICVFTLSLFWGFLFLNVVVKPQLQKLRFQSILNVWIMDAFQSLWTNVFSLSSQIRSRIDAFAYFKRKFNSMRHESVKNSSQMSWIVFVCPWEIHWI